MRELPEITAREIAADPAFQKALQNYVHANGSSETVAWCALRLIKWSAEKPKRPTVGTAEQAIRFALEIDDHFDLRQFLKDWLQGVVAKGDEWRDYRRWLRKNQEETAA